MRAAGRSTRCLTRRYFRPCWRRRLQLHKCVQEEVRELSVTTLANHFPLILVSGGHSYPDIDNGNEVLYCGTDSTDGNVTEYTQRMIESAEGDQPVRLIRSHNLNSEFAPDHGFRYDGLYDVVSFEQLDDPDSTRQRHRFRLVRQPNQDPIRGGAGPERRPTEQEIAEYKKHQRNAGKTKGKT